MLDELRKLKAVGKISVPMKAFRQLEKEVWGRYPDYDRWPLGTTQELFIFGIRITPKFKGKMNVDW